MAIKTFEHAGEEYQEPQPEDLRRMTTEEWDAWEEQRSHRVKIIDGHVLVVEPRQEGVTHYPPVWVEGPRDTDISIL